MIVKVIEIILLAAENAFLQVGVFVGAVLLIFGYINYKRQGRFVTTLENSKRLQPFFGSLLGITPGCGGAIFVMPLYLKGTVSFGTIIATLIATMGDAAFVLIKNAVILAGFYTIIFALIDKSCCSITYKNIMLFCDYNFPEKSCLAFSLYAVYGTSFVMHKFVVTLYVAVRPNHFCYCKARRCICNFNNA